MLTHQSGLICNTKFQPLVCAGPQIFTRLRDDLGLLAHTPNWDGGPPKNRKGKH